MATTTLTDVPKRCVGALLSLGADAEQPHDIDDIVSDAVVRALQRIHDGKPIATSCYYASQDALRAWRAYHTTIPASLPEDEDEDLHEAIDYAVTDCQLIGLLPDKLQATARCLLAGDSQREIAERIGVSRRTVRGRISDIADHLEQIQPPTDLYRMLCATLRECLRPQRYPKRQRHTTSPTARRVSNTEGMIPSYDHCNYSPATDTVTTAPFRCANEPARNPANLYSCVISWLSSVPSTRKLVSAPGTVIRSISAHLPDTV